MDPLVAVPVKDFASAKARLSGNVAPAIRRRLGIVLAEHTLEIVRAAGAVAAIVTSAPPALEWAERRGYLALHEGCGRGTGLDAAADVAAATAIAQGRAWLILHADLPLLRPAELIRAMELMAASQFVLCPSYDGGTNGFGGHDTTNFEYGPGSFHRHLAAVADRAHAVLSSVGLALDLDSADDLQTLLGHPDGAWLKAALARDSAGDLYAES